MGPVYDFFKCMACGKQLNGTDEQRQVVDREGFTRIYCEECYEKMQKG